jgi:SPX domain protein involved in polyphosphate accumulation
MRYERKYKLHPIHTRAVEEVLRQHPASFRELFPPRWVNNLYFDTPDFTAFTENTAGVGQRLKHRIRWYGRPFQQMLHPTLEIKVKDNELGSKKSRTLEQDYQLSDIRELLRTARQHWNKSAAFRPVLFNSYYRSYWGSSNQHFRITLDTELQYGPVLAGQTPALRYQEEGVVLEVKYPATLDDGRSDFIFQHLPFRQTKNSKYVSGISRVYG